MSTVLTNGIIIPENGSRNWGGDLANNWNILDVNVGYMTDVKNSVTTLENSVAENTANIQINASNISALQTSKQDSLSDQQIANIADVTNKANDNLVVHKTGDETIAGTKTFSSNLVGNLVGNADTATSAENGVNSHGEGWIRFNNGVQICWGNIKLSTTSYVAYDAATETYYNRQYDYNYAVPFSAEPALHLSVVTGETSPFLMVTCESTGHDVDRKTGTGRLMLFSKNSNGVSLATITYISVFAIGRWK